MFSLVIVVMYSILNLPVILYSGAVVFEQIFDISGILGTSKFMAVAILCLIIGIIGGYLTGVLMLHINEGAYLYRIASSVTMNDVAGGFIKSLVFGLLVATVCCHQGYTTHLRRDSVGPEAVGNATTSAVVISCVLILVADYVLTSFLL